MKLERYYDASFVITDSRGTSNATNETGTLLWCQLCHHWQQRNFQCHHWWENLVSWQLFLFSDLAISSSHMIKRAHSAIWLVWHDWAWLTCVTPTHLPYNPNASFCCPTAATWFTSNILVFICVPVDVSSLRHMMISNGSRELSQRTPEAATVTLLLFINWGVLMSTNWDNTSTGSWRLAVTFMLS